MSPNLLSSKCLRVSARRYLGECEEVWVWRGGKWDSFRAPCPWLDSEGRHRQNWRQTLLKHLHSIEKFQGARLRSTAVARLADGRRQDIGKVED